MIHDLDVILYLVRSPVKQVDAVGVAILSDSEDIANVRILFENGCVANITTSRVSQERMRKIRVFKNNAYLSLDYQAKSGETVYLAPGMKLVRESVPVEDANALLCELAEFVRCVAEAKATEKAPAPKVSGEDGLQALALAELVLAKIKEAGLVRPELPTA
jgi:predicted dehydrogenase